MTRRSISLLLAIVMIAAFTASASAAPAIGSTVTFGSYWQGLSSGKTPIEWLVIDVKTERGSTKALLLSSKGLDVCKYHETDTKITWENSDIRRFLNADFLNDAFNPDEQNAILESALANDRASANPDWYTDGSAGTTDKVFLLSYAELAANDYLKNHTLYKRCTLTEYAVNRGAFETTLAKNLVDGETTCWWWLRSPGFNAKCAAGVYTDGTVGSRSVTYSEAVIRPAIWVDLSKTSF